ncbi:hypothetical protein ACH4MA_20800 [Streptomyces roseolus]|uniref:hypothetical protein n=1 Tax=Streptomyces roseolus TaxID=67358 RepID=UPI0037905483
MQKLRRYGERGRLLPKDAAKRTVDPVRSRPGAIGDVDHELRLWRRVCPPTGREGPVLLAFVFADTTEAKAAHTVVVLEEDGRRSWAPRRYDALSPKAVTARGYRQAVPVVVTTLEQLQEHGAGTAVWRRLERDGEQTLTATLDNPDGHVLYRVQEDPAEAEGERRRAAEREAERRASAAGGSSTTRARRRSPCTGPPCVPGTRPCADRAAPTTSPARRPKPPAARPSFHRNRSTARSRASSAGCFAAEAVSQDAVPPRRARGGTAPTGSGLSQAGVACSASAASGERRPARPLLALTELTRRFRPRGAASRGRTEGSAHRPGHGHGP